MIGAARTASHAQPWPNKKLSKMASTIPRRMAVTRGLGFLIAQSFQMVSRTVGAACPCSITLVGMYEKLSPEQIRYPQVRSVPRGASVARTAMRKEGR
jgi:hypothetical protein